MKKTIFVILYLISVSVTAQNIAFVRQQNTTDSETVTNDIYTYQSGELNILQIQQVGTDNWISIFQNEQSKSDISQTGNSNRANNEQRGLRNKSLIVQNGYSNIAEVIQDSDDNESNLVQSLDGSYAWINQNNGIENKVNLTQSNGAKAIINQFGTENILMGLGSSIVALSLDGSTLDLNQYGNNNVVQLQQMGGSNHAGINQYGN